jgi:hypothetical protein
VSLAAGVAFQRRSGGNLGQRPWDELGNLPHTNSDRSRSGYFLKTASSAACAIASSISDFAPLAAMPPMVLPSTLTGSPP